MFDASADSDCESFRSAASSCDSFSSLPSLAETLESQFSDVPKNFNAIHINAQSIPAHFPDMLASFDCKNIHAIFISESWLKPCLPSTSYSLPGFQLIRNDRTGSGGGGVAIYLRSHIPFQVLSASTQPPPQNAGEHLFIEIELNHSKILLGVYYCPSLKINYFSSFEKLLELLLPSYSHAIIMGDFNTCLIKKDFRTSALNSIIDSCNLSILPLSATHNFPNATPSLLDLIIVTSPAHVAKHGQCSADAFSYHDLVFLSYKIRTPKAKSKFLMQRNFSGMNIDNLCRDASNIDWSPLFASDSINEKVNIFVDQIIQLYDLHAPVRRIKLRHFPSPWLTDDIKVIMQKKAAAMSKYKCKPTPSNRDKYVSIRNYCNKVCRDAQRRHIHKSVENGDPSKVWKFLRSLGVGKSRNSTIPKNLDINSLNNHFSATSNLNRTSKSNTLNYLSSFPTPNYSPFVFKQLSDCDVEKCILSISSNAVGSDCVSRKMIIPILNEIVPVISHILNFSLFSGTFPSMWKDAQLIPLPKKSNPVSFSEYRPISILPFISKVFERLVYDQLNFFLCKNNLLNPFQSGFRKGHSTTTALVKITDDIRLGMENGKLTILTLLDFSNAFNTVDFDILLGILHSLNISPTVIDWFHSYLFGRRQRIVVDDSVSTWNSTTAGVPQGGVLSPLLFAIFINSISKLLISSYHLYADDLQIYTQAPIDNLSEAIRNINTDLAHISDWSNSFGLTINPTKTQAIIVGSPRMISKVSWSLLPPINFDGTIVPISDTVKNLGILIDKTLSWDSQIREVSRKMFASAGSLKRLRNFLPTATKIALAQSLLLPILDYADASFLDLTEAQFDKLERLQNFSIRFIFGLRKYDHVSDFRKKLKWLPIRLRRNAHILSLLYNILFNPSSPQYLKERFEFLHDSHARVLRSSENLKLIMPAHSTTFVDHSFLVQAVRLWNNLPINTRRAQSLPLFKEMVKDHFLSL